MVGTRDEKTMIVDKINLYLASQGKAIDEAILAEVSNLARHSFERQFGIREEREVVKPYFSSIGRCIRQQAYKILGFVENGKEMDSRSKMVFFAGDMAELAIVQVAKVAGCEITACGLQQESIELEGMRGRPDGVLNGAYLVEVKSMSSFGFKDFERGVLDEGYRYQCNAGMEALKLDKCVVVALNKDAGVLAEMVISKDPDIVADIKERIGVLSKATKESLPDRPFKPDAKGFYPWNCRYCAWYKTCLPNAELVLVKSSYKLKSKEIKIVSTATA